MPHSTTSRIVVVGGGFAGLSAAVRLAQAGLPVTVLESYELGYEASTRNQGWLHSGAAFAREHADFARLCHQSLQQTLKFCPAAVEPQVEEMVYVLSRPDTLVRSWIDAWQAAEIPFAEVAREEVCRHVPGLCAQRVQHAFCLPDRAMRTDVLLSHLAAAATHAGAEIRTHTPVSELVSRDGAIQGVRTSAGEEIRARLVVIAAGAAGFPLWSQIHSSSAGSQTDFELVPLKVHLAAVSPSVGPLPFCIVDAERFNHLPHNDASVFGTLRWDVTSHALDPAADAARIEDLWTLFRQFFPDANLERMTSTAWAGTTVQAMRMTQVQPGQASWPAVIDHAWERPAVQNIVSIFPGRATLWPALAEETRRVVLQKLDLGLPAMSTPPWEGMAG